MDSRVLRLSKLQVTFSRRGLQFDASTPDDSRLVTPETTILNSYHHSDGTAGRKEIADLQTAGSLVEQPQ
jgi:hypothetical protein